MADDDEEKAPVAAKRPLTGLKLRPQGAIGDVSSLEEVYKILQWEVRPGPSRRVKNFAEKPPTGSERLAALRPYAEAIGQANFEWNKLQQWLSNCFWKLFLPNGDEALAVWDTLNSDRVQRQILLEASKVMFIGRSHHPSTTNAQMRRRYEIYDGIEFLVKTAEKFEDLRNNAIHAPVQLNVAAEHFAVYVDDQHVRGSSFKAKMSKRKTNIMDELISEKISSDTEWICERPVARLGTGRTHTAEAQNADPHAEETPTTAAPVGCQNDGQVKCHLDRSRKSIRGSCMYRKLWKAGWTRSQTEWIAPVRDRHW